MSVVNTSAGPAVKTSGASENCLAIGTRLSDFEITGVLGEGGFGIVYLAFDHALQRTVAIKEYMPGVLASRSSDGNVSVRSERNVETFNVGLKSFINEARFLAQFDHPSLVKVYRYWEQNRTAYTAMKYYSGRTIKDIVTSGEAVTETWCRSVIRQILDALELLDTMNIVHRDVSPDNIIVQDSGEAVLLDFGSARQIIGDATRGLTVILKPGYAPVEQYAGDASLEQGPYTDIYALSAVMYFAIVGEAPATSIARMVKDPLVPLGQRAPDGFSAEFLIAIDRGLAVLAAERPQSIDAFRALLGIQEPSAPRPKVDNASQRFATIERIEPGTAFAGFDPDQTMLAPAVNDFVTQFPEEDDPDATNAFAAAPDPAPAPAPAPASDPAPGEWDRNTERRAPAGQQRARPRWLMPVAAAAVLVGVVAGGASLLMGKPDEVIKPIAVPAKVAAAKPAAAPAAPAVAAAPAAVAPTDPSPLDLVTAEPVAERAATPEDVLAGTPAADKPPAPAGVPVSYDLAIRPWGVVYVDGKKQGTSPPLTTLKLTPGKHRIKVVNQGFPDYKTTVNVKPNGGGTITHHFAASSLF